MTSVADPSLEEFCRLHGVVAPFELEPIRAGRNSEVSRIVNADGRWILKRYYRHGAGDRDRLGTEFTFLAFLREMGVSAVAQPLGMDRPAERALYSHLPGERPSGSTPALVREAAAFVIAINRFRNAAGAAQLPAAADACFSWREHLDLAGSRVRRLDELRGELEVERAAARFVSEMLQPAWAAIEESVLAAIDAAAADAPIEPDARVLSPSDFGFHNTLQHDGQLSFVDFEYAGWDDPAKLICDFICQPELPVSSDEGVLFRDLVTDSLPESRAARARVEVLLPVHRLKWCCILLNEFREEGRIRRMHAGLDASGLLTRQLEKAVQYFELHLGNFANFKTEV